jgi:hypothetical protein
MRTTQSLKGITFAFLVTLFGTLAFTSCSKEGENTKPKPSTFSKSTTGITNSNNNLLEKIGVYKLTFDSGNQEWSASSSVVGWNSFTVKVSYSDGNNRFLEVINPISGKSFSINLDKTEQEVKFNNTEGSTLIVNELTDSLWYGNTDSLTRVEIIAVSALASYILNSGNIDYDNGVIPLPQDGFTNDYISVWVDLGLNRGKRRQMEFMKDFCKPKKVKVLSTDSATIWDDMCALIITEFDCV